VRPAWPQPVRRPAPACQHGSGRLFQGRDDLPGQRTQVRPCTEAGHVFIFCSAWFLAVLHSISSTCELVTASTHYAACARAPGRCKHARAPGPQNTAASPSCVLCSAVDHHTSDHMFTHTIEGLFKNKAVVLVTHRLPVRPSVPSGQVPSMCRVFLGLGPIGSLESFPPGAALAAKDLVMQSNSWLMPHAAAEPARYPSAI
jgi:hypothetical protein